MSSRRTEEVRIEQLRLRISELLLLGYSERAISKMVGKSASAIHHHVRALLRQWRQAQSVNVSKWRARQLARIEGIESEAWAAWEKSKVKTTTTQRAKGRALRPRRGRKLKPDPASFIDVSQTTRVVEYAGDAVYLERVCRCVELRARMLGLYDSGAPEPSREPQPEEYDRVRARLLEAITLARQP